MENMCSNCGFYKTPPLFWGGSTEPLLCDCPKERSYSEEEVLNIIQLFNDDFNMIQDTIPKWFEQFKKI